jgi:hypothetical protein
MSYRSFAQRILARAKLIRELVSVALQREGGLSAAEALRWVQNNHYGTITPQRKSRLSSQFFEAGPDLLLEVCWKNLPIGAGPTISLFIHRQEVLRFDCFAGGRAHMHAPFFLPSRGETRLLIMESSLEDQLARVQFELLHNLAYYTSRVSCKRIRTLVVDQARFRDAVSHACVAALQLHSSYAADLRFAAQH